MTDLVSLYNETETMENSSVVNLVVDNMTELNSGMGITVNSTMNTTDLIPITTATYNLGSPSKRYNNFYVNSIDTDYVSVLGVLDKLAPTIWKILMDSTNSRIRFVLNSGDFIDLESDPGFGSKIKVNYITFNTGSGTYMDQLYSSSILPQLDAVYDLGSASYKFVNTYTQTLNSTTTNATTGNITNLVLGTGTGILHSNGSGTITSSAVNLANTDVSGILPNAKTTGNTGNSVNTLVMRDASGNFSNNIITTIRLYCGRLFTDATLASGFVLNLTDGYMNCNSVQILKWDTVFTIRLSTVPAVNNTYTLGTAALKWSNVYATTFTGNLTGSTSTITTTTSSSNTNYYVPFLDVITGSATTYANASHTYNPSTGALVVGATPAAATNSTVVATTGYVDKLVGQSCFISWDEFAGNIIRGSIGVSIYWDTNLQGVANMSTGSVGFRVMSSGTYIFSFQTSTSNDSCSLSTFLDGSGGTYALINQTDLYVAAGTGGVKTITFTTTLTGGYANRIYFNNAFKNGSSSSYYFRPIFQGINIRRTV